MAKGFTGIRLLLIFVAVNTVLFSLLVTSMASEHPWLPRVLPGEFGAGVNASGYWVFFSLVLLVNAVTVLLAGFALVVPALGDGAPLDERRLKGLLANRSGIADDARESCLVSVRADTEAVRQQVSLGRVVLIVGAVFLTLAFMAVSLSMARAVPEGHMFADRSGPLSNATVDVNTVWRFTADQVTGALFLGVPEIYHRYFIEIFNDIDNPLYSSFVLVFRTAVGLVGLVVIVTLIRGRRWRVAKPKTVVAAGASDAA